MNNPRTRPGISHLRVFIGRLLSRWWPADTLARPQSRAPGRPSLEYPVLGAGTFPA
jgi:hypothetical protein